MRREQLFVHLRICAFVWPMRQQNHRKTTNTQKTPSDGNRSTMIFCKFVYLCIHQQNHSLRVWWHKLQKWRWLSENNQLSHTVIKMPWTGVVLRCTATKPQHLGSTTLHSNQQTIELSHHDAWITPIAITPTFLRGIFQRPRPQRLRRRPFRKKLHHLLSDPENEHVSKMSRDTMERFGCSPFQTSCHAQQIIFWYPRPHLHPNRSSHGWWVRFFISKHLYQCRDCTLPAWPSLHTPPPSRPCHSCTVGHGRSTIRSFWLMRSRRNTLCRASTNRLHASWMAGASNACIRLETISTPTITNVSWEECHNWPH